MSQQRWRRIRRDLDIENQSTTTVRRTACSRGQSLPELRAEERHGLWPRLTRRSGVRLVAVLAAQESVAGALEDVVLVRLSEPLHRGIGRGNRRVDTRVVAAV